MKPNREQTNALIAVAQAGDTRARNAVVESHVYMVESIAAEYKRPRLRDDLVQIGIVGDPNAERAGGLMRAIESFDASRGVLFSTYAAYWVRLAMLDYIAAEGPGGLPGWKVRRYRQIRRIAEQLAEQLRRPPTVEEVKAQADAVARGWHVSLEAVQEALGLTTQTVELPDGLTLGESESQQIARIDSGRQHEALQTALTALTPLEREVIRLRHPLDGREPLSHRECGKALSMNGTGVRCVELRALAKLRAALPADAELSAVA